MTKAKSKVVNLNEAVESDKPVEAPDEDGIMQPDQSFLTNPTDDSEEKLSELDMHYLNSLSEDRRALARKARTVLYDNVRASGDSIDALSLKDPSFRYLDDSEGVYLAGKLTIKYTSRAHVIPSKAIKLYLDQLQSFKGSAAELVAHICQDLFITLKPKKVSVNFVTQESGLDIRAQKTHEWGIGFKD